jgi:hypothetical protein
MACRQASQVACDDGTVTTHLRRVAPAALLATALLATCNACSDDDDAPAATDRPASASTISGTTSPPPIPTAPPDVVITAGPTFETVPETGVPGLDSSDRFCSAWSEFGGSWQVIVQSAFEGDPRAVARLEVIAAPLVTQAYDELFEVWPAELESERDVVADAYFGAFERRSADALAALEASGAGPDELGRLAAAWRSGLESFDPNAGAIDVDVDDGLESLVDSAAEQFTGVRPALVDDPSMVITAATPATDQFLATACPDQGWIVGQEVAGDA